MSVATPSATLTVHVIGLDGMEEWCTQLLYFNNEVFSRHGLSFTSRFSLFLRVKTDVLDYSFCCGLEVGLENPLARAFPHRASELFRLRLCGASTGGLVIEFERSAWRFLEASWLDVRLHVRGVRRRPASLEDDAVRVASEAFVTV